MKHITGQDVLTFFRDWTLSDFKYVKFHRERYAYLINFIADSLQETNCDTSEKSGFSILDIGVAPQTALIKHFITPNVYTLDNKKGSKQFCGREHFIFDLYDVLDAANHKNFGKFSVIVLAEVLEHVLVSPKAIFSYLIKLMKDDGLLFVQTPNAAGLRQRLTLLAGINPFDLPPDSSKSPHGHVREYTFKELIALGDEAGLTVTQRRGYNYFQVYETLMMDIYKMLCNNLLPYTLRSGITICFKKHFK
jgi:hypothetical protein